MKICPLDPGDIRLRQACESVSLRELKSMKFQKVIDAMLDLVYGRNNKGKNHDSNKPMTVGLSANQVGIMKQISIVDLAIGRKGISDIHVLINPQIIWHSKSTFKHNEGCVNLPEIWGEVRRYKEVMVEAYDRSGNILTLHTKGWPAVLLQHEIDHLNGYLYIDRLDDPARAHKVQKGNMQEYRKKKKEWNAFIDVSSLLRTKILTQ